MDEKKSLAAAQHFTAACLMALIALPPFARSASIESADRAGQAKPLSAEEERDLGMDTESLDRMEKIADAYRRRGLYSYAEAIIQEVFEIRRKKKGPDRSRDGLLPQQSRLASSGTG